MEKCKKPVVRLGELFDLLAAWCEQCESGIILIIDEVDSAANHQVLKLPIPIMGLLFENPIFEPRK